mmetsp:Transcript_75612/g.148397  ORF Transcript_75612/g.148397 Transcript_75612/m.148397 type:complete len:171 (+) Transcript_75612:69-581(+)
MDAKESPDQCPVCLEVLSEPHGVLTSHCGHSAHRLCVQQSVRSGNYTCPICRATYRNDSTADSSVEITDKRFIKFKKMLEMNMPAGAVRQRMEAENIPSLVIDAFLTNGGVHSDMEIMEAVQKHHSELDSQSKDKYIKMIQVGMSEGAVRQRMIADGISTAAIHDFLAHC